MGAWDAGAVKPTTASLSGGDATDHSSVAFPELLTTKPSTTPAEEDAPAHLSENSICSSLYLLPVSADL